MMGDLQAGPNAGTPDAATPDAATRAGTPPESQRDIAAEREADPKPVFAGDWVSASGAEKGRHSERVRQWRRREQERAAHEAAERMGAGSGQPVAASPSPGAPSASPVDPTRAVLERIRDDVNAHDSDRIRAAQQLIALDRASDVGAQGDGSGLRALRDVLDLLRPEERLAWLQAERLG